MCGCSIYVDDSDGLFTASNKIKFAKLINYSGSLISKNFGIIFNK